MSEYLMLKNKSNCCEAEVQITEIGGGFGAYTTEYLCLKCKRKLDISDIVYIGKTHKTKDPKPNFHNEEDFVVTA